MSRELLLHEVPDYFTLSFACEDCAKKFCLTPIHRSTLFVMADVVYCAWCLNPTEPVVVQEYMNARD